MARRAKKGRTVTLPWDEEGGFALPDGLRATFKCTSAEEAETQDGDPKIQLKFIVVKPKKHKGKTITQGFTIPRGLRHFRPVVKALLGKNPPNKAAALDLDDLEGRLCIAEVQVDEESGWTNLVDFEPVGKSRDDEDLDDEPEEDLEDLDDEDFEDELDDDDDEDLDDEDDLEDELDDEDDEDDEEDDEPEPPRRRSRRTTRRRRRR